MKTKPVPTILFAAIAGFLTLAACTKTADNLAINPANMDTTVAPGDDFFRYANGGWLKANPIPDDKTAYSALTELSETNDKRIKSLFEGLSAKTDITKGSAAQMIADFYASGMDTTAIDKAGIEPVKPLLSMIESMKTKDDLLHTIAELTTYQVMPLFFLYSGIDDKNSEQVIAQVWQGGLGLPEKDYYFNKGKSFEKNRQE